MHALCYRVMSGLITSPYFRKYFDYPGPIEIGTMVAVLEVGAFGTLNSASKTPARLTNWNDYSDFYCCWSGRRHDWKEGHIICWCRYIHCWWCSPNFDYWILDYDSWSSVEWLWCWFAIVSERFIKIYLLIHLQHYCSNLPKRNLSSQPC